MRTVIAIDPGASGGICARADGTFLAYPMPETRGDTISLLWNLAITGERPIVYMEKIASFAVPGSGGSAMFEFGRAVERPGAILETLGVPIIEITPQHWQRGLQLGKSNRVKITADMNEDQRSRTKALNTIYKRDWKNKLKAEAQRRFPQLGITLRTADAALILAYALQSEA